MVLNTYDTKLPWGIAIARVLCPVRAERRIIAYRVLILFLTYLTYCSFHMSRKPITVVKNSLAFLNCTKVINSTDPDTDEKCTSFISEMNGKSPDVAKSLEGTLDSAYLFSYAFFMFFSGFVAERVNLRYFLSLGCVLSGALVFLFGAAKYWEIHSLYYFIFIQITSGLVQSSGWPGVVTAVANWFGKAKKGLIFGLWNSHTSIGNIIGSLIAGNFVESDWGLSFMVPGMLIAGMGLIIWFFFVPGPDDVGLDIFGDEEDDESTLPGNEYLRSASSPTSQQVFRRPPELESFPGESTPLLQSDEEVESQEVTPGAAITAEQSTHRHHHHEHPDHAISFFNALRIPGVIEFAISLFFSKLVSYTFLYWLPYFIGKVGVDMSSEDSAYISTLFDVGGIAGGIIAGVIADVTGKSACTCAFMLLSAIPTLFIYYSFGHNCPLDMSVSNNCYVGNLALLILVGVLVNGPYSLITTAVSAELGVHPSLHGSSKALATVTAIIDGTGSIGAAIGPFIAGSIHELDDTFYMLMAADLISLICLTRLVKHEIIAWIDQRRTNRLARMYRGR